ncbi:MAG TPA: TetR/AcrR family transcriptional regulator [Candidatus Dietzia intestinigallinarum]|nr:TetR/AcrR family transcriptional regulator [Candidatus Dietzia intestinigallinarum]
MTAEAERAAGRPTGPGRPPEPGHDEKIIQATLRLIDQDKPVTVNAVVAGSGVSRAALYRRWNSLTDLMADALNHGRATPEVDITDDLKRTLLEMLFERLDEARGMGYPQRRFRKRLELVMADRDLQWAYWNSHVTRRRHGMIEALRAGVDRGEFRADLDVESALDAMLGVIYYQLVVRGADLADPETEQRCRQAFDVIWRGMGV